MRNVALFNWIKISTFIITKTCLPFTLFSPPLFTLVFGFSFLHFVPTPTPTPLQRRSVHFSTPHLLAVQISGACFPCFLLPLSLFSLFQASSSLESIFRFANLKPRIEIKRFPRKSNFKFPPSFFLLFPLCRRNRDSGGILTTWPRVGVQNEM